MQTFAGTTFLTTTQGLCGDDTECLYDTLATGNAAIGMNTMLTGSALREDASALGKEL